MKYFLCKIPTKALERLIYYSNMGAKSRSEKTKRSYVGRILTACNILCDCGILTTRERIATSKHFRCLVYLSDCDGNCQECKYAVWRAENLGELKIVGCNRGDVI